MSHPIFNCLCCEKDVKLKSADTCYGMCKPDDVNDVVGDVCEDCFGSNSDEDLYKKTGLIPCDSYSEELVAKLKEKYGVIPPKKAKSPSLGR